MTIVVTGGGSGGHITPVLAVASELKRQAPDCHIVYIGQRGEPLLHIAAEHPAIDEVRTVSAGKFRRYHGSGWKQLLALPTQAKNVRDLFRVVAGTVQSFFLLRQLRPAVVFTRGGFVSVPVALGAVLHRIPYVTHDSDSVPSLANRIIARWARLHAVALDPKLYPYPADRTIMVGIPLSPEYVAVTPTLRAKYLDDLELPSAAQVLLVTGGGNGAQRLNDAVVANAGLLLSAFPKLILLHIAGQALAPAVSEAYDSAVSGQDRERVRVLGFVADFYRYSGVADVIVGRAGATNLAEFAVQHKAAIIVPASHLVGGHQTKNAQALAERQAVLLLAQEQAEQEQRLGRIVADLLNNPSKRHELASNLAQFASPHAAAKLAKLLLRIANHEEPKA